VRHRAVVVRRLVHHRVCMWRHRVVSAAGSVSHRCFTACGRGLAVAFAHPVVFQFPNPLPPALDRLLLPVFFSRGRSPVRRGNSVTIRVGAAVALSKEKAAIVRPDHQACSVVGGEAQVSEDKAEARRYDRVAWRYDLLEAPMERMFFSRLRKELLSGVSGKVLEVGVGTGKSLPYYPDGVEPVGIDISPKMLAKAKKRAGSLGMDVDLRVMDVENLQFPDGTFDFIVVTFVFCSAGDPVKGLRELARVVTDDGKILMLEHVRSENINRRTVENVRAAGLEVVSVQSRGPKILKKIVAVRPPAVSPPVTVRQSPPPAI
jgi:protein-L-isoaspartate O-methyltransferase